MDLEVALKHMSSEDILKEIESFYGSSSLAMWLKQGFADDLNSCICKEMENSDDDTGNINKYLSILNEIIPNIPEYMQNEISGVCDFPKLCFVPVENSRHIDKLISKILKSLFELFLHFYTTEVSPLLVTVFIKAINSASERTITKNISLQSQEFSEVMLDNLNIYCNEHTHIFMTIFILLGKKVPKSKFKFDPILMFRLRYVLEIKENEKSCPLLAELSEMYNRQDFERKIKTQVSTWIPMLDIKHNLEMPQIKEPLTTLAYFIDRELICIQQFIQSGVMRQLCHLLSDSSHENRTGIKSFLTVFFQFENCKNGQYKWDPRSFEKLVYFLRDVLEYLLETYDMLMLNSKCDDESEEDFELTRCKLEKDLTNSLSLMSSLHILNNSWYQWFDIEDERRILEEFIFYSDYLKSAFTIRPNEVKSQRYSWFRDIAMTCPAIVEFETRRKIFYYALRNKEPGIFVVSRDNVLLDILNLFDKQMHSIRSFWNFEFENEIGKGFGPTKEVYSQLSREFGKLDLGSSQINVNTKLAFNFLGKLIGKIMIDGQILDVPLCDEFFKHLRPMSDSHLTKKYYEIPKLLPLIGPTIKQLISIKRQKENILSNSMLSKDEMFNMVNNLKFDDGNSFNDLYLYFEVPGTEIELVERGKEIMLTAHNVEVYLQELTNFKLLHFTESLSQFEAIVEGLSQVLPIKILNLFTPNELKSLICGEQFKQWTIDDLKSYCSFCDYGDDSEPVQFLFEILSSLNEQEQQMFLQFVTSTSVLPRGGLRDLSPPLTISKPNGCYGDGALPTASTCFNVLYLPEYKSFEEAREKLAYAIREGGKSFQNV